MRRGAYYEQSVTSTCVYGHGVSKSKPKKHVCTWLTIPLNNRLYDRIKSRSRPPIVLKCRARSSCTLLVTHRIRAIWLKPAWLLHSHISYLFTTKYILHYQLHRKWERNFCSKWKVHARNIFCECFYFLLQNYTRDEDGWSERRSISDVIAYYFACIFCCCI